MTNRAKLLIAAGVLLLAMCLMAPLMYSLLTAKPATVIINNQTGQTLVGVRIAQGSTDVLSTKNLIPEAVPSGRVLQITHMGHGCKRNIEISYDNGNNETFRSFNTCNGNSLFLTKKETVDQAQGNPSFNLFNNSLTPITEAYVTPSTRNEWGINRVANDKPLVHEKTLAIYLPKGDCTYDLRAIFADGSKSEKRKVNVCSISLVSVP